MKRATRRILLLLLGSAVATAAMAAFALAVFTPPDTDVFRPSGAARENVQIRSVSVAGEEYSYPLHFIEFDDEGFYADPGQKAAILEAVRENVGYETGASDSESAASGTLIVLYVHGLNHNARPDDDNVSCFGELLDAAAMMQRPRGLNVVGAYVGWPGLVYDSTNLNAVVAYLGREAAADRIAERGDLLDLFTNISRERHESSSEHTRFIIVGHSLGGRAAYMALRPIMQRTIAEGASAYRSRVADVTVFANPAFSAVEHSSLKRIMSSASSGTIAVPRFILLTSEGDEVLRGAFQISQKMTSFFRGDYGLNDPRRWTAAGQYADYLTHDLRLDGNYVNREGDGPCPRLSANELEIIKGKARVRDEVELYDFAEIDHYDNGERTYRTTLRRVAGRSGGEAMVIQVDAKIIPNHNDIFTTPTVDFIARILNCDYDEAGCRDTLASLEEVQLPLDEATP